MEHLWFNCAVVSKILDEVLMWQKVQCRKDSLMDWWRWFGACTRKKNNIYRSRLLAFSAVIYYSWLFRNVVIFNRSPINSDGIISRIKEDCKFRCLHKVNISSRRGLALARRMIM